MSKKTFAPEGAAIVGPYSPAVEIGGFGSLIYFSGQIPIDSATGKIIEGDIKAQTIQCLSNLTNVLKAASLTSEDIFKTTIYLTDINDFSIVNEVYSEYFKSPYPARTTIAVAALPLDSKIEIEVIAKR